jgi:hypothetical protein
VRELEAVLDAGPAASGWDEDQCWTLAWIGELMHERFGVGYTLAGLDVLLHRIGWSVQVPVRRAAERDEDAIAAWKQETWPVVKDLAGGKSQLIWMDGRAGGNGLGAGFGGPGFAAARGPGVWLRNGRAGWEGASGLPETPAVRGA